MDNAADRKDVRRREKESRQADVARREVLHSLMSTAPGRRWVWDTLASCHCFVTTFNGDPYQSAFQEGQRAVGLAILADIMVHCPDLYIQAQRESNVRDTASERRSSQDPDGGDHGREGPGAEGAGDDTPYGDFSRDASRDDDLYGPEATH